MGRGMADAIGRSANTIAGAMMNHTSDEISARQRQDDKLEQIRLTAQLRDPKGDEKPLTEGEIDEQTAGNLGTSVGDVRATRNAVKTGDTSAFREKKSGDVEGPDGKVHHWETNDYPPGFETQFQSKVKALYAVRESIARGKAYKDITEGRSTQQTIDQKSGIIAGTMKAEDVGQAAAAVKGEGAFKGTADTVFNQHTGDVITTPVGQSTIRKNDRPPPDSGARAAERTALTQERIAADNEAERIRKEKQEAMSKAYSVKARTAVEQQFAPREKASADKITDIERRLRATGGNDAPATTAAGSGQPRRFRLVK